LGHASMGSGELAKLTGVSTDLLRHYERIVVLTFPLRTAHGYRRYAPEALERVRTVRRALSIGFSLPELARVLEFVGAGAHRVCPHTGGRKAQASGREFA